jgi:aryl-alcohol dehydrogenase-like predicted oxidoreductase
LTAALKAGDGKARARYLTLQPEYNLYDRAGYEKDLEAICLKEGLGVVTYFSLASGFLTGKYRSKADLGKSPRGEDIEKYLDARGQRVLAALDEMAARYRATPAQIALAWLMARPSVTAPIASATSLAQLKDIMKATEIKLDRDAIAKLDATG